MCNGLFSQAKKPTKFFPFSPKSKSKYVGIKLAHHLFILLHESLKLFGSSFLMLNFLFHYICKLFSSQQICFNFSFKQKLNNKFWGISFDYLFYANIYCLTLCSLHVKIRHLTKVILGFKKNHSWKNIWHNRFISKTFASKHLVKNQFSNEILLDNSCSS